MGMTPDELKAALTARINLSLDFPIADEPQEAVVIAWCIGHLVDALPESLQLFLLDASDGLSAEERQRWEDFFTKLLNDRVDLPAIPEAMEAAYVFRPIVRHVLGFAAQGESVASAA